MSFSDWQIRVIRDALAAHRLYTPGERQSHLSWLELTAGVEAYGDIELGKDLLRQFVEGVSKKNPGKKREPEPPTLDAIAAFLTDPEIYAVSIDEIQNERAPAYQAPLRLLQYLKQDIDKEILDPPDSLSGNYEARCTMEDETPGRVRISFDRKKGGSLIAVTETLFRQHGPPAPAIDPHREKAGREKSRRHSRGWAILTPEDNILAFMKDEPYGNNHYYLTLAIDGDLWTETKVDRLVLLRQDYPLEFEIMDLDENTCLHEVAGQVRRNTLYFARVQ